MLIDFLETHRDELIRRTRLRVAGRRAPRPDPIELTKGIPLFLSQLNEIFRIKMADGGADPPELAATATRHGGELLANGLTVAQAIHDYGDICQVVTQLADELHESIAADEYETFNRCLDVAMANAVTEYLRRRDQVRSADEVERLGALAHEQRNLLSAAMLAFQVLRAGSVGVNSHTGAVLERSLLGLRELTDRSLAEVRLEVGADRRARIELCSFIEDVEAGASLEARAKGMSLTVEPAEWGVWIDADRQLLGSAVNNLLSNAFKFSKPGGHVVLRTRAHGTSVTIEVEDQCGGLPSTVAEDLFRRFEQRNADRTGLGLGLTIARKAVAAYGGHIYATDRPGQGCTFVIEMAARRAA
jgi:signal transduction histidine kinase